MRVRETREEPGYGGSEGCRAGHMSRALARWRGGAEDGEGGMFQADRAIGRERPEKDEELRGPETQVGQSSGTGTDKGTGGVTGG